MSGRSNMINTDIIKRPQLTYEVKKPTLKKQKDCPICNTKGKVRVKPSIIRRWAECWLCKGRGFIYV